nr:acyltransferase [Kocuria sp. CNJ-770]
MTHPTTTTTPAPPAPAGDHVPGRRPDIQGLRGVAVLLVVAFHLWTDRVSGGVDVFFVLSAFLLTGTFARRVERGRPLAVREYWVRTFARLIGPMAVMLLAVLAAVLALFPPSRWEELLSHVWGSLSYVQNWVLAGQSVDYYAGNTAATTPLQHVWSLSVQGQIFLLWPLLLAGCALVARRAGLRFRTVSLAVFAWCSPAPSRGPWRRRPARRPGPTSAPSPGCGSSPSAPWPPWRSSARPARRPGRGEASRTPCAGRWAWRWAGPGWPRSWPPPSSSVPTPASPAPRPWPPPWARPRCWSAARWPPTRR